MVQLDSCGGVINPRDGESPADRIGCVQTDAQRGAGDSAGVALSNGFFNSALLTAGPEERDALANLARVIFGVTDRDQQAANDNHQIF